MKVAIVAPQAVPRTVGGAERAVDGLRRAIERHTAHRAEVVRLPVVETDLAGVVAGYRDFAQLDLTAYDRVLSVKYPAWIAPHPDHRVLVFHPLRGLYDTYHLFGLPIWPPSPSPEVDELRRFMAGRCDRGVLAEFFDRFQRTISGLGADHPDLAFPGPFAREVVHWLDRLALTPPEVTRHLALSHTVARRPDYFPPGVRPRVVHLPGDLEPAPASASVADQPADAFFTASRLDGPKRLELLIDAMAHVPGDTRLVIAGTGPLDAELRARAAPDPRIEFLGYVPDEALAAHYRSALAVPFVPADEDLGLVTLEAFSQNTPVVTCTDSGGPTEFVREGLTGLVTDPDPVSLGRALAHLARDPGWAVELGRAARRRSDRVTWERAVEMLVDDPVFPPPAPADGDATGSGRPADPGRRGGTCRPRRRLRIVVLSTFTIDTPRHGGELRAHHLYGTMADDHDVHVLALTNRSGAAGTRVLRPGLVQTVVPRSPAHVAADDLRSVAAGMTVTDVFAGIHGIETPAHGEALARLAAGADVIVLAEPYLLPALVGAGVEVPFVYDAYNVEADLKDQALPDGPERALVLEVVRGIEARAVADAALVTTCSQDDADVLGERYGRAADGFRVVPNGTTVSTSDLDPAVRRRRGAVWRERFARTGGLTDPPEHLAVFFGSWHPPNLDAARLLFDVAADVPEVLIASCGGHGDRFTGWTTPPNLVFTGTVTDGGKDRLLAAADVALNPMRTGSGTNIKLIEYLAAGVPVLSTPFGARGLDVVDGEHLALAEPADFATAVRRVIADPDGAHRRARRGRELVASRYDWVALGHRFAGLVADLAAGGARQ